MIVYGIQSVKHKNFFIIRIVKFLGDKYFSAVYKTFNGINHSMLYLDTLSASFYQLIIYFPALLCIV